MKYVLTVILSCAVATSSNASLVNDSPFLPPGHAKKQTRVQAPETQNPTQPFGFQLKGLALLSGTYYFSIFDQTTKRSAWLESGESFNGLTIIGLNGPQQQLIVRHNHAERILQLAQADDTRIPVLASTFSPDVSQVNTPAVMISRRPVAFTARAPHEVEPTNTFAINEAAATEHSSLPSSGNRYEQSAAASTLTNRTEETLPLQGSGALTTTTGTELTKNFNNRFGIDRSRISGTW